MNANLRLGVVISAAVLSAAVTSVHAQLIVKNDWGNLNTVLSNTGNTAGAGSFATYSSLSVPDDE